MSLYKQAEEFQSFPSVLEEQMKASSPPIHPGESIQKVAEIMTQRKCSSLIICDEKDKKPVGIVTHSDLVQRAMACKMPSDTPVSAIMSRNIISIQKDQSLFDGLILMFQHHISHLVIMDGDESLGIVSEHEVFTNRGDHPAALVRSIKSAANLNEIIEIKIKSDRLIRRIFEEDGNAIALTQFINEINDRITERLIQLALIKMQARGLGSPPVSFAWIGMGSEGRKNQTLVTDQDNGIIFENVAPEQLEQVTYWFISMAEIVVTGLDAAGFPKCEGNIMATNLELCQPVDGWEKLFKKIISVRDAKTLLEASIYFDFRCIFGRKLLVDNLWDFLLSELYDNILFFRRFGDNLLLASRPPIKNKSWKWYPRFKLKPPQLNIKREALAPLEAAIRLVALYNGVSLTSTMQRLEQLEIKEIIDKNLADTIRSAFYLIMNLRVKNEFSQREGEVNNQIISLKSLNSLEAVFLKDALGAIYELQDFAFAQVGGVKNNWNFL